MITSIKNQKVKYWQKLKTKKERNKTNSFLIEGLHLLEEAIKSNWTIIDIIIEEGISMPEFCVDLAYEIVTKPVFKAISQTENSQGIAAVVKKKQNMNYVGNELILLDAIQDPGNLGTIIRTADAAGFSAVLLGKGTVDLYNDKVIRATQGSIFHIPIIEVDLKETIAELQENNYTVFAAALDDAVDYHSIRFPAKKALIVGNEGAGIGTELIKIANKVIKIPIYGKAESLNVSIAAAILMYSMKN